MTNTTETALAERPLRIFIDGSCRNNPGPGGWAFVTLSPHENRVDRSGHMKDSTNISAEMEAAIQALKFSPENLPLIVITKSDHLVNGFHKWSPSWIARDWRNAKDEIVANSKQWKEIIRLATTRQVTFTHTRWYPQHQYTKRAHKLAYDAALGAEVGQ